jgi:hypothetical protein
VSKISKNKFNTDLGTATAPKWGIKVVKMGYISGDRS